MTDLAGTPDDFSPPIAIPNPARASTLMTTPTPLDRGFLCFSAHSSSLTPSPPSCPHTSSSVCFPKARSLARS
ncbi:uncharacterized protein CLUP02_08606 [Colletotrichum lupini]|uniref:Uncharacterized protein n=4 Tax=Colletotrichum acutatum species complex TaxID=2707335 RepID=A0A9Q8STE2_9PEZI|nr:uncharacterized protein CLUP02_08606 [Colletotrichum lupini]XP_060321013.1 uncharacterized protein CCOS01_01379 [Colletotrichum costaricense]XP_060382460.1 uncharacterized protein CTAM01_06933 [Colletotrichum tamarilloi]KAI3545380.1 hypothetical protein CSPX01_05024 [Colletotrichum filicis]KAK1482070.1 hypothetical protein CCUS01_15880 [Colletotrichum cuscutae]KAK1499739.1 hypothetical protein CTAM01_06933 [Colletotrichum tamarilloi]KAK1540065.1 hypothetical protein CCOS01_01379 [Colletotr